MNLKHLFTIARYTMLVAVVFGSAVIISSCDDDEGPKVFDGNLLEYMSSADFQVATNGDPEKSLDSLVKYLNMHPELVALLESADEYTFFAPSNQAFINLLTGTPGFPSDIRKISSDIVAGVLMYHMVEGKHLKSSLTSGTELTSLFTDPTAGAQTIKVNTDGTLLTGSSNKALDITDADNRATNGIVHIVESVMIPPSVEATLTPILGTLAGSVMLGSDFTYLAKVITNADNGVGAADRIATLLATPNPTETSSNVRRTFFAPPNSFFTAAAAASGVTVEQLIASLGTGSTSAARGILLNHIVTTNTADHNVYTATNITMTNSTDVQFTHGQQLTSNAGKTLTIVKTTAQPNPAQPNYTGPYGIIVTSPSNPVSQVPIALGDVTHINGSVLHAVAGFLKPQ